MMRKLIPAALVLSLAAAFAFAQGEKKAAKISGFVIDNMCAEMHGSEAEAKNHPNACALMEACEKSGFAIATKEKVYKLDAHGNELALALIKESKTKKGLAVTAEGTLDGDTLRVDTLVAGQ